MDISRRKTHTHKNKQEFFSSHIIVQKEDVFSLNIASPILLFPFLSSPKILKD